MGEVDGLGIEDKDVLRTLRELATSHSTFAEAYAGASPAPSTCPRPGRHAQARALRLYLDAARLALLGIDGAYSGTAEGPHRRPLVVPVGPACPLRAAAPSHPRTLRLVDVEGELSDIEERIIAAPSRLRGEDGRILRRRRSSCA